MSEDTVSYRYAKPELRVLSMVMGLVLPGLDLPVLSENDFHRAVDGLERAGCAVSSEDQLGVDSLTALLLNEMADCGFWARLDSDNGRTALLWRGAHMYITGAFSRSFSTRMRSSR